MIRFLNAAAEIFDRCRVSETTTELAEKVKQRIKDKLKGRYVAITTDHWSSCAQHSYLAVTAHVIDVDWKLQR
jgi:hypothetical protein